MNGEYKYVGQPYFFTRNVKNLRRLPRFGYDSDFTKLFSSDQDEQVEYATGLVALFMFLLIFFIFWTIALIIFKIMGGNNAGFLSGRHFEIAADEKNIKRPRRVRIAFLVATGFCMAFTFLFVVMGLTSVNNATTTMQESLFQTGEILSSANAIARNIDGVGKASIEIRDAAVQELNQICPANPNIADMAGIDIMSIASKARNDLTELANFINDGIEILNENLDLAVNYAENVENGIQSAHLWGWQMKLLSAGLFILPSFFIIGVGLVILDIDLLFYQNAMTYFFMPLFAMTVIVCYIVCAATLPISATAADACTGGGAEFGGPDDTILTIYRNLRGVVDDDKILQFLAFYTQQRCNSQYDPFGFLGSYLTELDNAVSSTNEARVTIEGNLNLLTQECGRSFESVIVIVDRMNSNLVTLRQQVDLSLELVKCKNINDLYVNTVHQAGCEYSMDALAWIFASALVVSVSGLTMIMLRSAYYPEEYLDHDDEWETKPALTKSASEDDVDNSNAESTVQAQDMSLVHTTPESPRPSRRQGPQTPVQVSPADSQTIEEEEGFEVGGADSML